MSQDQKFKEKWIKMDSFAGKFCFGTMATLNKTCTAAVTQSPV